jgi:hypothetical protein
VDQVRTSILKRITVAEKLSEKTTWASLLGVSEPHQEISLARKIKLFLSFGVGPAVKYLT